MTIEVFSHTIMDRKIVEFLRGHHVATLATSISSITSDIAVTVPWVAHCFYVLLEDEASLVFTSDVDTRHGKEMLENQVVAVGVALETKTVGKIRGVQIEGNARQLDTKTDFYKKAKTAYLKAFPYAVLMKTTLWAVDIQTAKLTDNRLGFGKKITWQRG